jgi:hypothetical protein
LTSDFKFFKGLKQIFYFFLFAIEKKTALIQKSAHVLKTAHSGERIEKKPPMGGFHEKYGISNKNMHFARN